MLLVFQMNVAHHHSTHFLVSQSIMDPPTRGVSSHIPDLKKNDARKGAVVMFCALFRNAHCQIWTRRRRILVRNETVRSWFQKMV